MKKNSVLMLVNEHGILKHVNHKGAEQYKYESNELNTVKLCKFGN